jgi:hypothetical protein
MPAIVHPIKTARPGVMSVERQSGSIRHDGARDVLVKFAAPGDKASFRE